MTAREWAARWNTRRKLRRGRCRECRRILPDDVTDGICQECWEFRISW